MELQIQSLITGFPMWALLLFIGAMLAMLAKAADVLVEQAVRLSRQWEMAPMVIGATIVSLGTTLPEAAVSVTAALQGNPDLALGNAVGSIICDAGLILGIALILGPIPLDRRVVNRQGWLQIIAAFLLIGLCIPYGSLSTVWEVGGRLPQWGGWILVALLFVYIGWTLRTGKGPVLEAEVPAQSAESPKTPAWATLLKLSAAIAVVVLSSHLLIPGVSEVAVRMDVPKALIAATLVAFGTSLPELVTAVASVRRKRGDLALGNIIGADILNVLFVAGAAAAVTPGGLQASPEFFRLLFPAMAGILIILRIAFHLSGKELRRGTGFLLLGSYLLVTGLSYFS